LKNIRISRQSVSEGWRLKIPSRKQAWLQHSPKPLETEGGCEMFNQNQALIMITGVKLLGVTGRHQ
jgi:hypothetical protein